MSCLLSGGHLSYKYLNKVRFYLLGIISEFLMYSTPTYMTFLYLSILHDQASPMYILHYLATSSCVIL